MKFEPDSALLTRAACDSEADAAIAAELGGYVEALLTQRRYRHARKVMRFCMDNWRQPSPIVLRYVLSKLKPYEFLVEYAEFYEFCCRQRPDLYDDNGPHRRLESLLRPVKKKDTP